MRTMLYRNRVDDDGAIHKPQQYRSCLFRVLPQYTNTSAKALRKWHKKQAMAKELEEKQAKKMSGELEKAAEEEEETEEEAGGDESALQYKRLLNQVKQEEEGNAALVQEMAGKPVRYGTVIQLQHLKTGLFVATQPKIVADQERSCSAVQLQEKISSGCFFKVESRYKFREDGAQVLQTDEIYLCNTKVEQYIHAASRPLPGQPLLAEVNASQALRTRWKICMFGSYEPNPELLQAGDCVRLYHPESSSALSITSGGGGEFAVRMEGFDGESSLEKTSTNSLWIMEKEDVTEGGGCSVARSGVPCTYRFCHLSSGRYLAGRRNVVAFDPSQPDAITTESNSWMLSANDVTRTQDSLFCFDNKSGQALLKENAAVVLQHDQSSRYVHAGDSQQDDLDTYAGAVASQPCLGSAPLDEHTLVIQRADPEEITALYFLLASKPVLSAFVQRMGHLTQQPSDDQEPPDALEAVKGKMSRKKGIAKPTAFSIGSSHEPLAAVEAQFIIQTLTDLIFFVTQTESTDPYTCEGLPVDTNQKMMREQRLAELLVEVLKAPFEGDEQAPYDLAELEQGHPIIEIGQLSYRLLHHMSKDYERNELYLAPYIDFFIDQSCKTGDDNDLYAEATLTGDLSVIQSL